MRSKSGHSAMAPCCVQEKIVVHSASIENRKVPDSKNGEWYVKLGLR